MGRRGNFQNAPELLRVARQFAAWRDSSPVRTRIPDRLWAAAAKAAASFGVHQTAKALRLDYYSLKDRVEKEGARQGMLREVAPMTAFVELPSSSLASPVGECIIKCEKPDGSRLRVHLKGVHVPDLLALGAGFWSED
jgi:hypothetical protein